MTPSPGVLLLSSSKAVGLEACILNGGGEASQCPRAGGGGGSRRYGMEFQRAGVCRKGKGTLSSRQGVKRDLIIEGHLDRGVRSPNGAVLAARQ